MNLADDDAPWLRPGSVDDNPYLYDDFPGEDWFNEDYVVPRSGEDED